jgi:transcriptional regulator with XRE-family HTH domain
MAERFQNTVFDHSRPEESRKQFGQTLRSLRESRGFSLTDLSQLINVNPSYLSRVENGRVPCSANILEKTADVFKVARFDLALQAGFLESDITKFSGEELLLLEKFVNEGTVTIDFLQLLIR